MTIWDAIWKSIILGTVQGLTEFLPVSSSGHLSLLQRILGFQFEGGSMTFINVMLHIGTLIPVIWIFRKEILDLFHKPFKMLFMLIVATIPAGVVGLLFNDKIDALFSGNSGLTMLALCFAFTACLLFLCEYIASKRKHFRDLGWRHTVPMGIMQAVALFPGISRSGSTIVAGTVSGAKAEDVAKFSFLMSVPVILGSAIVELKDVVFPPEGAEVILGAAGVIGILFGMVFAAVSGFFAVKLMLKVIRKANYKWFVLYLLFLSFTCLWLDILKIF